MRDTDEAGLLRAIAEDYDDNNARMILADWLEERGETARAEFVRVQCELAAPELPAKRRQELQVRERALLDAHRRRWIEAFGLPIEDVCFERGLIAAMRLSQWDGGKLLEPEYASRLVTLKELDLSGLHIGDRAMRTFAEQAQFPALRKLILAGNAFTDDSIPALAAASGMPHLDTLYLFGNALDAGADLEHAEHFHLSNLDLGEPEDGYEMTPGQADAARRQFIREHLLPIVDRNFRQYECLQSAMLCVAQYWADEANDAVHGMLVVSELPVPTLKGVRDSRDPEDPADVNVPNSRILSEYGDLGSVIDLYSIPWDDNNDAIPLWAAFAPEQGSQEYEFLEECYLPAVLFYRHGGYEILEMARPHLDGIRPELEED